MEEIRNGINPLTKRKIQHGKLGRLLREIEGVYSKNPKALFAPGCPSVVISGRCLRGSSAKTAMKLVELEKKTSVAHTECEKKLARLRVEHEKLESRFRKNILTKLSGDYNKMSTKDKNKYNRDIDKMNDDLQKLTEKLKNVKGNYNKIT